MGFSLLSRLFFVGIALVAFVTLSSVSAFAEVDLQKIERELTYVEGSLSDSGSELAKLRGRHIKPMEKQAEVKFKDRFHRAKFLYKDKDYLNASIILIDLLEYPDVDKRSEYYELMWFLGDSYSRTKNYIPARQWLEKVVDEGQMGKHFKNAIVRLIEIELELGRLEEAETYYKVMNRTSGAEGWDLIQYAFAKSLQKEKEYDRAIRTFRKIPVDSDKRHHADYFIGVVLVQQKKLDEALTTFKELRKELEGQELDGKKKILHELTILAIARILFETKKHDKALSLYRLIPVESPLFDEAYYEICWVYIEQGKYEEAASTLDLLLLARPDSSYAPNAQVLKGNIQLWEQKYKDANYSFDIVINKYADVINIMDKLLEETEGKRAEEIQQHILGDNKSLPEVAITWISEEEDVRAALSLSKDLQQSEEDSENSERVIKFLRLNLEQKSKSNIFKPLKKARERVVEIQLELTGNRKQLVDISMELFGNKISVSDKRRLENMQNDRDGLDQKYADIPKTADERKARRLAQTEKMEKLEKSVFDLQIQLKSIDHISATIMDRYEIMRGDPKQSQTFLEKAKKEVGEALEENRAFADEVAVLENDVMVGLEQIKIGEESTTRDLAIKNEIESSLEEEEELMSRIRQNLSPGEKLLFDRIQKDKREVLTQTDESEKFLTDLDNLVTDQVDELRRQVDNLEREMKESDEELEQFRAESSDLAAYIAYQNLRTVRDRFYDVVLKANVGQIDIVWEQREEVKDKIGELLQKRSEEKEALSYSFRELRGE